MGTNNRTIRASWNEDSRGTVDCQGAGPRGDPNGARGDAARRRGSVTTRRRQSEKFPEKGKRSEPNGKKVGTHGENVGTQGENLGTHSVLSEVGFEPTLLRPAWVLALSPH